MPSWTKETGLTEMKQLIQEIDGLCQQRAFSTDHTRWVFRTLALLEEVFGRSSRYYLSFAPLTYRAKGSTVLQGVEQWNIRASFEKIDHEAYLHDLGKAKGLLEAAMKHLERTDLDAVYEGKDTPPESSAIMKIINIADRKLRKVIRGSPSSEKEVQEAFENLLIGADIAYSRETERIEYSSKTFTPDFTVQKIDLAIEIKLCTREGREKEIIDEINADILAYHTKYGNLVFVIYDLGYVRDVDRFTGSFEAQQNTFVRVVKH